MLHEPISQPRRMRSEGGSPDGGCKGCLVKLDETTGEFHNQHSTAEQEAQIPEHSVETLPLDVLRQIDDLTQADAHVFRAGALRVLRDLRKAEVETGMPLLCKKAMENFTNRTGYIDNLVRDALAIYHESF